jgi:hypothetical protein
MTAADPAREHARTATGDELTVVLHHHDTDVLLAVLDNPTLDETQLCRLLDRKDLPIEVLEQVGQRKPLLRNYRVKRALAFHPRTPRLIGVRLIRDLYLMDLAQLALAVGAQPEIKRIAEDQLLARLSQLPLGQKIALARRGPARVAGAFLAEGHPQILTVVLDNAWLTEAQILKALSRETISVNATHAIAQHRRWSGVYNVRLALIRAPGTTLASILAYLPEITVSDLRDLSAPGVVPESLRKYLEAEIRRRTEDGGNSEPTT